MCDFKLTEHKMTQADVRRIAKGIVWNNTPSAIAEDAAAAVSVFLANDPMSDWNYNPEPAMYWQPDTTNPYADRHRVTDEQFQRLVAETDKQAQRVSKLLGAPATNTNVW